MTDASRSGHRSFLVTSLGAYADSGLGTGGFTCVREGEAVVIDKIDSTALHESGGAIYRFARGLQSIVGYGEDGLRSILRIPEARDVHDVLLRDGHFVCVSTGTNEVVWVDPLGRIARRWTADGVGDAWHLNCLYEADGRLFLSAFGRFSAHREWLNQCAGTGFVFDLESGREVLSGLSGPHNQRFIEGEWVVCNSHAKSLVIQRRDGRREEVALNGFTRGLAYDGDFFYVGESANRKAEIPADHSFIAIIDRRSLNVVDRIRIPFPEIYEIVLIAPEFAARITGELSRFQIDRGSDRIRELENQVELSLKEIEALRVCVHDVSVYMEFKAHLTRIKRRLIG